VLGGTVDLVGDNDGELRIRICLRDPKSDERGEFRGHIEAYFSKKEIESMLLAMERLEQ
jgi:hypothetical protein